ncbi:hypothetical protein ACKI1J_32235 [Streptomyces scabiei]|uniref:hypothetical protein n=1 Tax=Streptomyces scabiei TaxID=1930 RepID=UPI0039F10F6E
MPPLQTPDTSAESVTAFLQDLSALTEKYGLVIAGCGCCGSPWLNPAAEEGTAPSLRSRVQFNHQTRQYGTES